MVVDSEAMTGCTTDGAPSFRPRPRPFVIGPPIWTRRAGLAVVALVLSACAARRERSAPTRTTETIDASAYSLPDGARPGMSIAWREEMPEPEADDVVTRELACVGETAESITMETRTTDHAGRRLVVTTRHARDGRILAAWRGAPGGIGQPVALVESDAVDWEERKARSEEMLRAYDLPTPSVSTAATRETIETPAGRIPCTRETIRVSILGMGATTSTWRSVAKLPLTNGNLVRWRMEGIAGRWETTILSYALEGATPSLTIPP